MFGSIGMPELIIVFVIALIIFGPRKLPELGRSLGKSLAEFKRASNELKSTLEEEIRIEEQQQKADAPKPAVSAPALAVEQDVPAVPAPALAVEHGVTTVPAPALAMEHDVAVPAGEPVAVRPDHTT